MPFYLFLTLTLRCSSRCDVASREKDQARLKRLPFSISVLHMISSIDEEESYRVPT